MTQIYTYLARILVVVAAFLAAAPLTAQNLKVTDLKPIDMVLHGKQIRTDVNGAEAAMVRVQLPVPGARFDGNLIGEAEYYGSEYWVWLEGDAAGSGTSMFDIMCPGAPTLHVDFTEFGIRVLKSKGVYELTLDVPRELLYGRSSGPADLGGDYFVLTVTPKENVMVKVDGALKVTRGGQLNEFLTYGDHTYSIEAPGYISESGTVTISRGGGKATRNIALRSAMGTLSISAETPGTVISVNGQRKGTGSWSAPMMAGNYQIEATLDGHHSYSTALIMTEGENKSITIPALEPIYAALQVDYYPSNSKVSIDGKPVGVTPLALNNLTAGKHSLEIAADGYQPYRQQITLTEDAPLRISGELTAKPKHTVAEADQYLNSKQYDKAVPIYREFAEQGDAYAQGQLGWCYNKGYGVAQSWTETVKWYRKSAEQGNAWAQGQLGWCYEKGNGVAQSYTEAVKWYRKSAELGHAWAQCQLGLCYANGNGVAQSWDEAVKWYRKSAELGHPWAQNNLGLCYEKGKGVAQSWDEAVKWYRKGAEQGNELAQNNLGLCYEKGNGAAQSWTEAVKWYRKSAEQGEAYAQCNLGWCYENGKGVAQSWDEAVKWYRKSAEQGNARAQCNLGVCYEKGQGVSQSYAEAVKWYRKSAEQGDAYAQCNLGYCYESGNGVAQSWIEAVKWYKKSAEQGNARAQYNLGVCYDEGNGVTQSYTEAVKWYRKSAEQGYAWAQNNLANRYWSGNGVAQDKDEAVRLWRLSAKQGNQVAKDNLKKFGYSE